MSDKLPCISIKPSANRHGLFLTLTGFLALIFFIFISSYFWQQARLVLIFFILLSIVTCVIGLVKQYEPKVSFLLTPQAITFVHRYGRWQVNWQEIRQIGQIRETFGIEIEELPYIAFSLAKLDPLARHISPRLANRLIHEQKPLLMYCISRQLLSTEQSAINFEPFVLSDGQTLKGPVAAFLHQCRVLHQALGYHLFVHASNIDRPLDEFCQLLRRCKTQAPLYQVD